jgi:alpha-beta hydrolase superfamily lysophospholipase
LTLEDEVELYKDLPTFLFGQSMGSEIVLGLAITLGDLTILFKNFRGIIAQSPALVPVSPLPFYVFPLLRLAKLFKPVGRITQPNQLVVDGINSDPEEVRIYNEDPLIYDRASLRLIRDVLVLILMS